MGQELGISKEVEFGMNLSRSPSPTGSWELGLGDRKQGSRAQLKAAAGLGSRSFFQEAVGGVLIAMPLKFPELLLLQGQHGVHLHHSMADSPIGFLLAQKQQG